MIADPLKPAPFTITSRYYGIETAQLQTTDGRTLVYLKRRFLPTADRFSTIQEHQVQAGERPDLIAADYLGDPEQYWRICDANTVITPQELTDTPGRPIRITLPADIPGYSNA